MELIDELQVDSYLGWRASIYVQIEALAKLQSTHLHYVYVSLTQFAYIRCQVYFPPQQVMVRTFYLY